MAVECANPSSGAYGMQALPASKPASAGDDWKDNAATQIRWGLNYIAGRWQPQRRQRSGSPTTGTEAEHQISAESSDP